MEDFRPEIFTFPENQGSVALTAGPKILSG
jgi:hypothetical protein